MKREGRSQGDQQFGGGVGGVWAQEPLGCGAIERETASQGDKDRRKVEGGGRRRVETGYGKPLKAHRTLLQQIRPSVDQTHRCNALLWRFPTKG